MFFDTDAWDLALFRLVNDQWRNSVFDWLMPVASMPWLLWAAGGLLFVWLLCRAGWRRAAVVLLVVAATGAADLSAGMFKRAFGRVRPLNALEQTHFREDGKWQQRSADFVQTKPRGKSYVSAHAANSMAAAVMIMLLWPGARPWMLVLPLLVGYSRLYLGKHYPTDVLAGWGVGAFASVCTYLFWLWLKGCIEKHRTKCYT